MLITAGAFQPVEWAMHYQVRENAAGKLQICFSASTKHARGKLIKRTYQPSAKTTKGTYAVKFPQS